MKKVVKIVLVVKEEEPKQLQQKLLLEMQRSMMSYGTVGWCMKGKRVPWGSVSRPNGLFVSSNKIFEYSLEKREITRNVWSNLWLYYLENRKLSISKIKFGKKMEKNFDVLSMKNSCFHED